MARWVLMVEQARDEKMESTKMLAVGNLCNWDVDTVSSSYLYWKGRMLRVSRSHEHWLDSVVNGGP